MKSDTVKIKTIKEFMKRKNFDDVINYLEFCEYLFPLSGRHS